MNSFLRKTVVFSFLFIFLLAAKNVDAQIIASDISYSHVTKNQYKFTLNIHRYCYDDSIDFAKLKAEISCKSKQKVVTLKRTAIKRSYLASNCVKNDSFCLKPNEKDLRDYSGIEQFVYEATIDFDNLAYKDYLTCCDITFACSYDKRSSMLTNIQANQGFYTYLELDVCQGANTSPQNTTPPYFLSCCNTPYFYNYGSLDINDFDSLSFKLVAPRKSKFAEVDYKLPYKAISPFKVYDPSGKGYVNPNVNPPLGFYIDSTNGDLIFTPTECNTRGLTAVVTEEWRKINGSYKLVGSVRRELFSLINACPGNNPPTIKGPYTYQICEGTKICFDIETDDKPKVIPGQPAPPKDSVRINWNKGIPGATFTVIDPKALHQTGRFCWTAQKGDASVLPYTFIVSARDNACPLNMQTKRAFSIKVNAIPEYHLNINQPYCNQFEVELDYQGSPSDINYNHLVLRDINNNSVVGSKKFLSNGKDSSTLFNDLVFLDSSGQYIIESTLKSGSACVTERMDTLLVKPFSKLPQITNDGAALVSNYKDGNEWVAYDSSNVLSSNQKFTPTKNGFYQLIVDSGNACKLISDSIYFGMVGLNKAIKIEGLALFPNPIKKGDLLYFNLKESSAFTISIYNAMGKRVLYKTLKNSSTGVRISNLNSGVYQISVEQGNRLSIGKLVVYE